MHVCTPNANLHRLLTHQQQNTASCNQVSHQKAAEGNKEAEEAQHATSPSVCLSYVACQCRPPRESTCTLGTLGGHSRPVIGTPKEQAHCCRCCCCSKFEHSIKQTHLKSKPLKPYYYAFVVRSTCYVRTSVVPTSKNKCTAAARNQDKTQTQLTNQTEANANAGPCNTKQATLHRTQQRQHTSSLALTSIYLFTFSQ